MEYFSRPEFPSSPPPHLIFLNFSTSSIFLELTNTSIDCERVNQYLSFTMSERGINLVTTCKEDLYKNAWMMELVWRGSPLDTKLFMKRSYPWGANVRWRLWLHPYTSGLGKRTHIPTQIIVWEYGWSQSCTHTLTLNVIQCIDNIC